eukprot:m.35942 g.35942  ORF g.35942 m.35942 type:complete len:236 (-) comp8994_c0_seq2:73-780(-)
MFEFYAMDVGSIATVRLRRTSGETWRSAIIRIQKIDTEEPSVTFECSPPSVLAGGETEDVFFCIRAVSETNEIPSEDKPVVQANCSCFREFTILEDRVLICTSDGCFATSSDGENGWSDLPEVSRLLGVGTDARFYAKTSANDTIVSDDAGINWATSQQNVAIEKPVMQYVPDVHNPVTTPLDQHILRHGDVEWGITSGGVLFNRDGTWSMHAVWACACDGACGLKCNQPSPNLL